MDVYTNIPEIHNIFENKINEQETFYILETEVKIKSNKVKKLKCFYTTGVQEKIKYKYTCMHIIHNYNTNFFRYDVCLHENFFIEQRFSPLISKYLLFPLICLI